MKNSSNIKPSTTAITAGALLFHEFEAIKPILALQNTIELLNEEVISNQYLKIKSQEARKRIATEIKRRIASVDTKFWKKWITLEIPEKKLALIYVILKTYPIAFDLHFEVTLPRWKAKRTELSSFDFQMRIDELASQGHIAEKWTDQTINRTISHYMTILRDAGLMKENTLHAPPAFSKDFGLFMAKYASPWFFDACFLSNNERMKFL